GHRFRYTVDHNGLVTIFFQCQGGMHTAIVEFDSLANAVGPPTQDNDFLAIRVASFALLFISGIEIGSIGSKLGGTSINSLINGANTPFVSLLAHLGFHGIQQKSQPAVGKTTPL